MTKSEDDEVWQQAISGITPIPESKVVTVKPKPTVKKSEKEQTVLLKIYNHNLKLGTTADIDRATMRKFKREEFPIEGILDLHGYTESQAFEAVHKFITEAYLHSKRCVIIVTGKGLKHQDEDIFAPKGVLKDRVPQWLNNEELQSLILSYIHPSERLGGKGALYILLRRKRS